MNFFFKNCFQGQGRASESLFGGLVPTNHTRSVFPTPTLTFHKPIAPESYLGHASTMALRYTEALSDKTQITCFVPAICRPLERHVLGPCHVQSLQTAPIFKFQFDDQVRVITKLHPVDGAAV